MVPCFFSDALFCTLSAFHVLQDCSADLVSSFHVVVCALIGIFGEASRVLPALGFIIHHHYQIILELAELAER
jgi:hypothetical protein